MSHNPVRKCCIQHCSNEVRVTARALKDWGGKPPCYSCRHVYRYWLKQGADAIVARELVVLRAADRMHYTKTEAHQELHPRKKK